jgi:hypothetical protein
MMKATLMTSLKDGSIVNAKNAATSLMRLQQIRCGYLPQDNGEMEAIDDSAIQALLEVTEQREGQTVIWCRFKEDIKRVVAAIEKRYGKKSVGVYYGKGKKDISAKTKSDFLAKRIRFFVGNRRAAGPD